MGRAPPPDLRAQTKVTRRIGMGAVSAAAGGRASRAVFRHRTMVSGLRSTGPLCARDVPVPRCLLLDPRYLSWSAEARARAASTRLAQA